MDRGQTGRIWPGYRATSGSAVSSRIPSPNRLGDQDAIERILVQRRQRVARGDPHQGLAGLGDDEALALRGLVDRAGQVGPGFVDVHGRHGGDPNELSLMDLVLCSRRGAGAGTCGNTKLCHRRSSGAAGRGVASGRRHWSRFCRLARKDRRAENTARWRANSPSSRPEPSRRRPQRAPLGSEPPARAPWPPV